MNAVPALLLLTLLMDPTAFAVPDPPSAEAPEPSIAWSRPSAGADPTLAAWHARYVVQIHPVLAAWARMTRRLRGDLPALFGPQCEGLVASLRGLDEQALLPVPDLLVDLYFRRLLTHLHAAATACTRDQLWNVVYRLEEARTNLGEVRWLLEVRGLRRP